VGCVFHELGDEVIAWAGQLGMGDPYGGLDHGGVDVGEALTQPILDGGQVQPMVLGTHCPKIGQ